MVHAKALILLVCLSYTYGLQELQAAGVTFHSEDAILLQTLSQSHAADKTQDIQPCLAGFQPYLNVSDPDNYGKCIPCLAGFMSVAGSACIPCSGGKYNPFIGSAVCYECRPGHVGLKGGKECVLCESGSIASDDKTYCSTCPPGKWSIAGDFKCRLCPQGTYNRFEGKAGCLDCGIGLYNPNFGAQGREACLDCPAGFSCPKLATAEPVRCDQDHFSVAGDFTCHPCPLMFTSGNSRQVCSATFSFYCLVVGSLLVVFLCLVFLRQCPKKKWTRLQFHKTIRRPFAPSDADL